MNRVIYQAYQHFYNKMNAFVEENKTIKSCDICFVGDSLTEMMNVKNFKNLNCVNRGISSDKSAGILMTLDDRVIAINPKQIFLLIGSNDICDGYTIKEIEYNIKDIIAYCKEKLKDVRIVVSTVLPPCYYDGSHIDKAYPNCRDILRIKALNEIIKTLKDDKNNIDVFDAYSLLKDENDSLSLDDTLDGVHLTEKAYNKLKEKLSTIL